MPSVLRAGPVGRLTLGLVAMSVSLVMALDLAFDVIPDRATAERAFRQRFAESLAVQVASLTESADERTLGKTLQLVATRNPEVLSVALRQAAGYIVAQRGDHARHWIAPETGRSTLDHVRVPIHSGRDRWGDLEIAFASATPSGIREWMSEPTFLLLGALCVGGLLLFYPYLRRALHFLDPAAAIPDRVRKAFDALTDGVVVVDPEGRIVLANNSFRQILAEGGTEVHGRKLAELPYLQPTHPDEAPRPWDTVFRDGKPVEGYALTIDKPGGGTIDVMVGCSPITDNDMRVRGCLVTFDDVTEIHRTNERLRETLADLERSREKIQAQNRELELLASRDSLTGCLNRRAFFADGIGLFDERLRTNRELSCIMADIDHFKSFNDLYGHAIGDQVIQVVARTLGRHIRAEDLLCRYGGEEFCILLPDADLEQARAAAERMRAAVETTATSGIRSTRLDRITASFGVASIVQGAVRVDELIDQADNALYRSKEGGRNRVTVWESPDD
jgi:diguanylate cyclase (GGDEF)-like protein/PAS domain S-box-containing protein